MIPKRIVIDTNVCLDLFVFRDPRWQDLLDDLVSHRVQAIARQECKDEWLAVLRYPHLPITEDTRANILAAFDQHIHIIETDSAPQIVLPVCKDKDDQKFLESARDGAAKVLITKDKALLKLAKRVRKMGLFSIETPEQYLQSRLENLN
ncbi:putative toxin-antitoxin system toxin component, PIN family [Undibacterium sp. CY7W]|uniref:Toxin-antitoxin system toxin component, PIN family n=2 Tax=Undibacterium rugosum TaxID=2762291 RepID=A0A923I5U2_9BURK|nr:putative toxin-antitoxin system toxin component, PIN family [Undibacterium rugosum]MBR7780097.1 putative toxin-antitoxin system toxin component, PIN family [Undibacterium rugosum]